MMSHITAGEMMVSNLKTLSPEMDVLDALDVLLRNNISGAPVVDSNHRFLGSFSEKSCVRYVVDTAYEQMPSSNLMAFVDTSPPVIGINTSFLTIAQTFLDAACRRLPVLDDNQKLLGQISRRDLMREVKDYMRTAEPVATGSGLYLSALFADGDRPV